MSCDKSRDCRSAAVVTAVVLTEIAAVTVFGVPLAVIDEGENVQLASVGRPEHEREMVPLKLVELETDTDDCPDTPGDEITTVDCEEATEAKNPGVMVKVWDCVLLLGLKLGSPL